MFRHCWFLLAGTWASMPALARTAVVSARSVRLTPVTSARGHAGPRKLLHARCAPTSDEEHAVSMLTLGPCATSSPLSNSSPLHNHLLDTGNYRQKVTLAANWRCIYKNSNHQSPPVHTHPNPYSSSMSEASAIVETLPAKCVSARGRCLP